MLPFRALPRTDLACSSRHPTCNPRLFILLRTLLLSWRSFPHSHRLFSIACGLFYKNTRGGIPLSRPQGAQIIPLGEHTLPHLSPLPGRSRISFRINTCKSVSKQTTLSTFRINTYEKPGEGGPSPLPPRKVRTGTQGEACPIPTKNQQLRTNNYLIDMTSFSFDALRSSIFLVSACDTFSSSSSARFFSSSLIFFSFSSFSMASFSSRRMLRTAVR